MYFIRRLVKTSGDFSLRFGMTDLVQATETYLSPEGTATK